MPLAGEILCALALALNTAQRPNSQKIVAFARRRMTLAPSPSSINSHRAANPIGFAP
jgi:hypothetical protein